MIQSKEEFARIWKKDPSDLSQLDFFSYLLINKLESLLIEAYSKAGGKSGLRLETEQIGELVVQLADGLQFFFEQICFGKGCALGCPNRLDRPFCESEEDIRLKIIDQEFKGNAAACKSREDCLRHDLMNYSVMDTIQDFIIHFTERTYIDDDPAIRELAGFVVDVIIHFTTKNGPVLLKEPYKKADQFKNYSAFPA